MPRSSALPLLLFLAGPVAAQTVRPVPLTPPIARIAPRAITMATTNPNAARLGVTMGETGAADTLGVLVDGVTAEGPAAKAGLKAGDRIQSINGVNLKLDRSDANDETHEGLVQRRLQREMAKAKPGDDIALRVLTGNSARNVTVKAAAERELMATTAAAPRAGMGQMMRSNTKTDRAALGVQLGGSPSKRDTLGVLVIAVNADGPAEKAGIIEGDRIARINGVDLRVPGVDAGDAELSQARVSRLHSEMAKLEPGAVATLTMVTAGRSREVRVTTAKSSEMGGAATYFFNDGQLNALRELPALIEGVRMPLLERQIEGRRRVEEEQVWSRESLQRSKEAMKRAEEALQRARIVVPGRRVIVV